MEFNLIKTFGLMLAAAVFLLLLLHFVLRSFKRIVPGTRGVVQVIGGTYLGHKCQLVLVKVRDQELLLGINDHQIQTLLLPKAQSSQFPYSSDGS